jgi:outer membrane protein assembly factor BamB
LTGARPPGARLASCIGLVLATVTIGMVGCRQSAGPPAPTFAALFPAITGDLMTSSSPSLTDLDEDGIADIVFGTGVDRTRPTGRAMQFSGEPAISGEVVAVSGKTNRILWKVANPRDAFTTPRFARLNRDTVPDVIMGGREGVLSAYDGKTGVLLWRRFGEDVVRTPFPYYFLTPALIGDVNGDGVTDLVDAYGGNDTRLPKDPRDPGYLMVISGIDGLALRVVMVPDSAETYASPVVYGRRDGTDWVVFGTGGETHGGAEYRAPVASLLDGTFPLRVERLAPPGRKGVIAPPTIVELTGDDEPDLVVSTFDGRLMAIDGASGRPIWQHADTTEETYHSAAVVRLDAQRLGLFVSRGIGAFPKYVGTVHRLYDAADGRVLYEYRDPNYPGGAPLAIDLTGDGVDEPVFFSVRFPAAQGGRIHVLHVSTRTLRTHDVATNLWSTPAIADPRGSGRLEMIATSWLASAEGGTRERPGLQWQLLRLDLSAPAPRAPTWAGYMGTYTDGRYRPESAPRFTKRRTRQRPNRSRP